MTTGGGTTGSIAAIGGGSGRSGGTSIGDLNEKDIEFELAMESQNMHAAGALFIDVHQ